MKRRILAVLTLTALAAFEAVTARPAAAVQLDQARIAAGWITAITDTPDPVHAPGRPRALPPGPFRIQLLDATVRYRPDGPPALDRVSLDLPPGRRVALVGANGAGKSTLAAVLLRFSHLPAAEIADELFVSVHTVKSQQASLYRKLGTSRRVTPSRHPLPRAFLPRP